MWWFVRSGDAGTQDRLTSNAKWGEAQLLAHVPDMSQLSQHEVAVKVWLPEEVAQTLKWVADYEGVSQSSWIREHLMGYVYGQAALLAHRIRARRAGDGDIRFSRANASKRQGRWVYKVPQLGKNAVAFKVWMSAQMQQDLLALATHAGIGLSPFLREAVVGELFGRGSLPERPEIIGMPSAQALAWEEDAEVPTAVIEVADFHDLGHAERLWIDVGKT
jgi:predicted DNA-binding protein